MSTDVRVLNMRMIKALGVPESVPLLYPRLMQLHDLVPPVSFYSLSPQGARYSCLLDFNPAQYGEVDERGRVKLPPLIRTSAERLNPAGAYVIGMHSAFLFRIFFRKICRLTYHINALHQKTVNK